MATKILEDDKQSGGAGQPEAANLDAAPGRTIKTKYVLLGALILAGAFSLFGERSQVEAPPPVAPSAVAPSVNEDSRGVHGSPHEMSSEAPNDEVHRQALGAPASLPVGADPHAGLEDNPHATLHADPGIQVAVSEKPAGPLGRSVAELYQQASKLANQKVRLRGTVVRSTGGINGSTYAHLRDGTGEALHGTNDVTVTTNAVLQVADYIEVEGTVRTDVDLGLGYHYAVLLEDATVLSQTSAVQRATEAGPD